MLVPVGRRCGDGVCNGLERCWNCASDCGACVKKTAGASGDPHFTTLDGVSYDFNAPGEFKLLVSSVAEADGSTFKAQGRLTPCGAGSCFGAVAFSVNKQRIALYMCARWCARRTAIVIGLHFILFYTNLFCCVFVSFYV